MLCPPGRLLTGILLSAPNLDTGHADLARAVVEAETPSLISDARVLEADQGRLMGFIKLMARRKRGP